MTDVPYRPLGLIKTALESLGFEISHYYEDLIFVNHNAFLLLMERRGAEVSLFFNTESTPQLREEISSSLQKAGTSVHLSITRSGTYSLIANEADATLDLRFSPAL